MEKINKSAEKSYNAQFKRQEKEIEDQAKKIEHQDEVIEKLQVKFVEMQGDMMALVRVIRDSNIEISPGLLREETAKRLGLL